MKYRITFILFSMFFVLFTACKKDNDSKASFSMQPKFEGENFQFEKKYTNHLGQTFKFEFFKFYLNDIVLIPESGAEILLSDVELFDLGNLNDLEIDIPDGEYKAIQFGIGLDSLTNKFDPNSFEAEHPLSYAQNTHWDWASLYKFMQIEGRVDTADSDFLQKTFAYHTGFDALYKSITIEKSFTIDKDNSAINLVLNIDKVFDAVNPVDVFNNNTSHSLTDVARDLHTNMAKSFELSNL